MRRKQKKIIILGGTGNGSVIAYAIVDAHLKGYSEWEFCGYLNDRFKPGEKIEGYPVLGNLTDVDKFLSQDYYFINTIYRIDGQTERINLFDKLNVSQDRLATFIHPSSYIAPDVKLGLGNVVMPNASISSGAVLGNCCLVMVNATVGHNDTIGNHCHFAAQSCLGAYLNLADGVHIGLNATIRENISIGKNSTIGMGSVLLENVGENEIWVGNPAKFLRKCN